MIPKLTTEQKLERIYLGLKIIKLSIDENIKISKASKQLGKNRRYCYHINERYIRKNNGDVPYSLIDEYKQLFKPKSS